jgi:Tol biopolymer transport system component
MAVTAPPRVRGLDESEQLEALIKEARRRARLRRLRYATLGVLVASAGAAAVLGPGGGGGAGGPAAPEPVPADAEIKLAGPRLAYVPQGAGVLYVTEPDGSGSRALAACPRTTRTVCVITNPVWSPDGRQIAFLRGRRTLSRKHPGDLALYVIGLDGRGERRLAKCGGIDGACGMRWGSRLSWSPDSSQIAFSRGGTISIIDVESARVRRLTRCGRGCRDVDPAWSPDQAAIAFTRVMEKEWTGEIQRVSVSRPRLISLAIYGRNPTWAPDGRTLLVETLEGVWRVVADGSQATLTAAWDADNGPAVLGSLSRDGSRILYFSMLRRDARTYGPELWTMRPNGTGRKRLYRSCCQYRAVWSADGRRVAFSTGGSGNRRGVFVVDADGTHLQTLARLPAELAWQPVPNGAGTTRR